MAELEIKELTAIQEFKSKVNLTVVEMVNGEFDVFVLPIYKVIFLLGVLQSNQMIYPLRIVHTIVGLLYLIEFSLNDTAIGGEGAAWAYIAIEFISITENAGKIGVPLGPLGNIIAVLKEKVNGK